MNIYLVDNISIQRYTRSVTNELIPGELENIKGRFTRKTEKKPGDNGIEVFSTATVRLPGNTQISLRDRIIFNGSEYAISEIVDSRDFKVRYVDVKVK